MPEPRFISYGQLETGAETGNIVMNGDTLTLVESGTRYRVVPGVRIKTLIDGSDEAGLVGSVKSLRELESLGAEHFQGAVVLGEAGYECEEGYLGWPLEDGVETNAPNPAAHSSSDEAASRADSDADDVALLTEFLLKNLK